MQIPYICNDTQLETCFHVFMLTVYRRALLLRSSLQGGEARSNQHGRSGRLGNQHLLLVLFPGGGCGHVSTRGSFTRDVLRDHTNVDGVHFPGQVAGTHCKGKSVYYAWKILLWFLFCSCLSHFNMRFEHAAAF